MIKSFAELGIALNHKPVKIRKKIEKTKDLRSVIYRIRKTVWMNKAITLCDFELYFKLSKTMDDYLLLPHDNPDITSKIRENALMQLAVGKARKQLQAQLADKNVLECNYHPDAVLTADYSGQALQGKAMGSRPYVGMVGKKCK